MISGIGAYLAGGIVFSGVCRVCLRKSETTRGMRERDWLYCVLIWPLVVLAFVGAAWNGELD